MTFNQLNLEKKLIENLNSLGISKLTPIQERSLPLSLQGEDVVAKAKTGSGKTIAFSLPIVHKLNVKQFRIQSLILAPTRELANQIANEIRKCSRHIHNVKVLTLCGGVPFKPQVASLYHGAHIVVGTPGRILKHIQEENINLEYVQQFVLDEADKMLDMGFYEDIEKVIQALPAKRQTMLFSATYEENIQSLAKEVMQNPKFVEVEEEEKPFIQQYFYEVNAHQKTAFIPALIQNHEAQSTLIFCNTKIACDEVADELYNMGLDVLTLHSDLEQKERDETITLFAHKSYPILIATDVASRGLHIDDIELVVNYDLARDEKVHTHRIGRTARAGKGGVAISLFSADEESYATELTEFFDHTQKESIENISNEKDFIIDAPFRTLFINGGKKQKLRKGDILGALTAGVGLKKEQIGQIDSFDFCSYVAVKKEVIKEALEGLSNNKIKGKFFRVFEK